MRASTEPAIAGVESREVASLGTTLRLRGNAPSAPIGTESGNI